MKTNYLLALIGVVWIAALLSCPLSSAEEHKFQAEVSQLMDIIVNSLYSNKDVFLRELISNASDALDKIRFFALTDQAVLSSKPDLDIRIRFDPMQRTLSIIDSGVGMTRDDLVNNLGTIAKSGTKAFLSKAKEDESFVASNSGLIGQFGVGFYSAFLVADRVQVRSKHNDESTQWVWESDAQGSFSVVEDTDGEQLGRGTEVKLFLKEDHDEYLDEDTLTDLVHRYSEFITFPIYLWTVHEEERIVESDDEVAADADADDEGAVDVEEEEDDDDEAEDDEDFEPETELYEVWEWEKLNEVKPIWTRDAATITKEEYDSFYQSISGEFDKPLVHAHFKAEGEISFRSILYVPPKPPGNLFDGSFTKQQKPLRLYVKRVFITDNFEDIMPKYLSFIRGVVDSDDIDLNVSREMLQQSKLLDVIKKKLVRKSIGMFQELARDDDAAYQEFFKQFGTSIKWGALEDRHNKARLEKLLRFRSSSVEGLTSLDDYIERMPEGQDQIFYIAGQDIETVKSSPLLERIYRRGYEVLFMVESIDEYLMQSLTRYGDQRLTNVAKEGLKLGEDEQEELDELKEQFADVVAFVQAELGVKVASVQITNRLTTSPSALVAGAYGWSANMERLAKAQALADHSNTYKARRILELNPFHPIVQELQTRIAADPLDTVAIDVAQLTYHSALLTSGFEFDDPNDLSRHLQRIMVEALSLDPDAVAAQLSAPDAATDGEQGDAAAAAAAAAAADEAGHAVAEDKDEL
jgi:heat shock protein 90kDa beta